MREVVSGFPWLGWRRYGRSSSGRVSHAFQAAPPIIALLALTPAGLMSAGSALPAFAQIVPRSMSVPVTSHPRLWLTGDDLPRYRSWATDANPLWRDGLWPLVERMTADMDAGIVPGEDPGLRSWTAYPTESYAELFAFVALVHPTAPFGRSTASGRARC